MAYSRRATPYQQGPGVPPKGWKGGVTVDQQGPGGYPPAKYRATPRPQGSRGSRDRMAPDYLQKVPLRR